MWLHLLPLQTLLQPLWHYCSLEDWNFRLLAFLLPCLPSSATCRWPHHLCSACLILLLPIRLFPSPSTFYLRPVRATAPHTLLCCPTILQLVAAWFALHYRGLHFVRPHYLFYGGDEQRRYRAHSPGISGTYRRLRPCLPTRFQIVRATAC